MQITILCGDGAMLRVGTDDEAVELLRVTDTWATDPGTGEQGLRSVEYRAADEDSRRWACPTAEELVRLLDRQKYGWDATRGDDEDTDCARWGLVEQAGSWWLVSAGAGGMDEALRFEDEDEVRTALALAVQRYDDECGEEG